MSDETDKLFRDCDRILSLLQYRESDPEAETYHKLFEKSLNKYPKTTCDMLMNHHSMMLCTLTIALRDLLKRFSPSEEATKVVITTYNDLMVEAETRLKRQFQEIAEKSYAAKTLELLKSFTK